MVYKIRLKVFVKFDEMESVLCDWLGAVGIFFCAQRCTIVPSRIAVLRRSHIFVQTELSMSGSGRLMRIIRSNWTETCRSKYKDTLTAHFNIVCV